MSDEADIAQDITELRVEQQIKQIQRLSQSEGLQFCEECGDEIPELRRKACPSARMCVDCQSEFEHKRKVIGGV